jgi:hypothetical protein
MGSIDDAALRAKDKFILEQQQLLQEKEAELARHNEIQLASVRVKLDNQEKAAQLRREQDLFFNSQVAVINTYVNGYISLYSRQPTVTELKENFKNEIQEDILDKFLSTYDQLQNV